MEPLQIQQLKTRPKRSRKQNWPISFTIGDSKETLSTLKANSIDLTVTSPPYDNLRKYGEDFKWDFAGTALELARVTKKGGVICWNVGDQIIKRGESLTSFKQAIFFVEQAGLLLHDTMIYEKLNFSHPERVRYHQTFEYVFILAKGPPKTFNPIKDKKNVTAGNIGNLGKNSFTLPDGSKGERARKVVQEFGMRTNVWKGKTRGQEEMCEALPHSAMMPKWLAHDLIVSWSNPGDMILDPFAGSGTTGHEAGLLGRKAILIEKEEKWRKELEKATQLGLGLK